MKIPASKVPAQVWADRARRRADLDEVESMLLSSWDDSKQVYRIGKELWDELRIDEADEVPVDALLRLPYGCIFIERRWVDEYEQLLTDDMIKQYHGWGMRINWTAGFDNFPYYWIVPFDTDIRTITHTIYMGDIGLVVARDADSEFLWFCYRDSGDERLVADALIDYVTRKLLPMTCRDGAMMRDGSNGNILQKMWSVIHSCVFTSEVNPVKYYILRCKHCGRVRIVSTQGRKAYFCNDSCRVTWSRNHRNQNCASSDRA